MKRYMLLPEDTIELLPQDGEAESAVSVFCERTLILFPCSKIESVSLLRNVREDRRKPEDCLCIRARDALFDTPQEVLVPIHRDGFEKFRAELAAVRPELFEQLPEQEDVRETCDQTGSHLHRHG